MLKIVDTTWPEWTIGDRIRKARRHAGLSQDQLAERIESPSASLAAWELDYQKPRQWPVIAAKVALATGIDRDWLLAREPEFCSECGHCAALQDGPVLPAELGGVTVRKYLADGGDPAELVAYVTAGADLVGPAITGRSTTSEEGDSPTRWYVAA